MGNVKREIAFKLRREGLSWEEVSKKLKCSKVYIYILIKRIPKCSCEDEQKIVVKDELDVFCFNCFFDIKTKRPLKTKHYLESGRDRVREMVRIRDKNTCQTCKKIWKTGERRFDVHHLNGLCGKKSRGYDRTSDTPGLITLCHKCHFNHPEHSMNIKNCE